MSSAPFQNCYQVDTLSSYFNGNKYLLNLNKNICTIIR